MYFAQIATVSLKFSFMIIKKEHAQSLYIMYSILVWQYLRSYIGSEKLSTSESVLSHLECLTFAFLSNI